MAFASLFCILHDFKEWPREDCARLHSPHQERRCLEIAPPRPPRPVLSHLQKEVKGRASLDRRRHSPQPPAPAFLFRHPWSILDSARRAASRSALFAIDDSRARTRLSASPSLRPQPTRRCDASPPAPDAPLALAGRAGTRCLAIRFASPCSRSPIDLERGHEATPAECRSPASAGTSTPFEMTTVALERTPSTGHLHLHPGSLARPPGIQPDAVRRRRASSAPPSSIPR
jgi:hypothetical protein